MLSEQDESRPPLIEFSLLLRSPKKYSQTVVQSARGFDEVPRWRRFKLSNVGLPFPRGTESVSLESPENRQLRTPKNDRTAGLRDTVSGNSTPHAVKRRAKLRAQRVTRARYNDLQGWGPIDFEWTMHGPPKIAVLDGKN